MTTSDLVARLTARANLTYSYPIEDILLLRGAADEIERLNAANARLREALKPFAKAGELFCIGDEHLDMLIYAPAAGDEYRIVGDDLKRACAALVEQKSTQEK